MAVIDNDNNETKAPNLTDIENDDTETATEEFVKNIKAKLIPSRSFDESFCILEDEEVSLIRIKFSSSNEAETNFVEREKEDKKYSIRYMRAPHMFFFSVKVFEKVSKLENSPFYRNG